MTRTAVILLPFLLAAPAFAAPLSAADRAWIATCADQLKGEKKSPRSVQVYCTCMHDYFDDNAKVTQTGMERMFPPAHRLCRQNAGWK